MNRPACCNDKDVADRLPAVHRPAWREALAGLAGPAVRLHRWRETRERLLRHALDDSSCE